MSMKYVRETYNVPAKRGWRVRYTGGGVRNGPQVGKITSATQGGLIRVRFDGDRRSYKLHPTWAIEYLTATETNEQRKG